MYYYTSTNVLLYKYKCINSLTIQGDMCPFICRVCVRVFSKYVSVYNYSRYSSWKADNINLILPRERASNFESRPLFFEGLKAVFASNSFETPIKGKSHVSFGAMWLQLRR